MSDSDPIPVIEETTPPVLSYANLRGQQPIDSRFVCEVFPDGVRLTEEPLPSIGRGFRVVGLLLIAIGLALEVLTLIGWLHEDNRSRAWPMLLFPLLLWVFPGWLACWQCRVMRTRPTDILVMGKLLTVNVPVLIFRRIRRKVTPSLRVHVMSRGLSYIRSRRKIGFVAGVYITKWGLRRFIVFNHPTDECEWLARELELGIQRSLEASGVRFDPPPES